MNMRDVLARFNELSDPDRDLTVAEQNELRDCAIALGKTTARGAEAISRCERYAADRAATAPVTPRPPVTPETAPPMRGRLGRPGSRPARRERIYIRASEAEKAEIMAATPSGQELSDWLRDLALAAARGHLTRAK